MKKMMLFVFAFLILFTMSGCVETKDPPASEVESLAGYIAFEGNVLNLDEVEVILIGDEEAMPLFEIKSLEVAVTINDEKRMAELELQESDFPNRYYIHHLNKEIAAYELTDETTYSFVDTNLLFVQDADGDRIYSTKKKEEYIQHLSYYFNPPNPPYIVFIQVQNGKVVSITEVLLFTI